MEVSDGELCAVDVDGEVDFGASGQVFDIAVSSVFGATLDFVSMTLGLG